MKNLFNKAGTILAALALFVGISSMNSASAFWFNQPKAPESMKKFIK